MACLGHIGCDPQHRGIQVGVGHAREPLPRVERLTDVGTESAGNASGDPFVASEGRDDGRPVQRDVAESHRGDPAGGEVVEPRLHERRVGRRAGRGAAVADPQLGVGERVELLAFHDPRIEGDGRLRYPRAHPVQPVLAGAVLPVAEQLGDASRSQHRADLPHERGDEVVARHATVAVLVCRYALDAGSDHEGRVGHHPPELLAGDRLEEAAEPSLDPIDVVEEGVQAREREGALRDVRRHDVVPRAPRTKSLDAAPRADVEHASHRGCQLQPRERQRGAADSQDMARGQRPAHRCLVEVARDPPVALARGIRDVLRSHQGVGHDEVAIEVGEPELREARRPERGQRGVD